MLRMKYSRRKHSLGKIFGQHAVHRGLEVETDIERLPMGGAALKLNFI